MSSAPHHVELSETAQRQLDALPEDGQAEVRVEFAEIARDPLGRGSRIRSRNAPIQPLFYARTLRFGIFFTLRRQQVNVLGVFRRPKLES